MLNSCSSCARVFKLSEAQCPYCGNSKFILVKKDSPVNVLGTKLKGRIFKKFDENVLLIINTESNEKVLKEFKINQLKKIN
ncbi:MAG: hypothetical protein ACRC41_15440 [Sarcina sp.]